MPILFIVYIVTILNGVLIFHDIRSDALEFVGYLSDSNYFYQLIMFHFVITPCALKQVTLKIIYCQI